MPGMVVALPSYTTQRDTIRADASFKQSTGTLWSESANKPEACGSASLIGSTGRTSANRCLGPEPSSSPAESCVTRTYRVLARTAGRARHCPGSRGVPEVREWLYLEPAAEMAYVLL